MTKRKPKRRTPVTLTLPDELIQELVLFGRETHISVRGQIRLAFLQIAAQARPEESENSRIGDA
jgi:hypothetical protein